MRPILERMQFLLAPLVLAVALLTGLALVPDQAAASGTVEDIRVGEHRSKTRFVVEVDGKLDYRVFALADPYRVVIDLAELKIGKRANRKGRARGVIEGYRVGLFKPGTSRIVLDLDRPALIKSDFVIPPRGGKGARLVVDLEPASRSRFLAAMKRPDPLPAGNQVAVRTENRSQSAKRVIVIDPGHGGIDPGAPSVIGVHEKNIVLQVARVVRDALKRTGRYEVVLTRDRDVFIPLRQRFEIARAANADLFISLHADSFKSASVRGASVYTLSERASDREAALLAAKENKSDVIAGVDLGTEAPEVSSILIDLAQRETMNYSAHFAGILVGEMAKAVPMRRNSHRFAGFVVLKAPDVPSVLVEMGYLSNPQDATALSNRTRQVKLANSLRSAIDRYFIRIASDQGSVL